MHPSDHIYICMDELKIIEYIKGETTPEEKKLFLDWIDESDDNRAHYRKIRELWDMSVITGEYKNISNEETYLKIRDKIEPVQHKPRRKLLPRILINIGRVAAVAAITLLISYQYFKIQEDKKYPGVTTIEVPIGDRTKISLPDGSTVWLNSGTRISYPQKFTGNQRIVTLNGEAQFEVAKDEKKTFIVETNNHAIRVLGTVFNVYAYDNSNIFEATLTQGSITLENKDGRIGEKGVLQLKPGQQAVFDKTTQKFHVHNISDTENASLWISGYYVFNKTKFSNMLERLSQYYGKEVVIRNPEIAEYECTGKFLQGQSLEHILEVASVSKPFKYTITEKEIIVY